MPIATIAEVLHTPRLTLTRFDWSTADDAALVIACFNDPAAIAAHGDFGIRTAQDLRALEHGTRMSSRTLDTAYKRAGRPIPQEGLTPPPLPWYIVHLGSADVRGKSIGSITLMESNPPVPHVGWQFLHEHTGNGYATEAAGEVLRYWQEEFGIEVVMALTDQGNAGSYRVAQKIGLVEAGSLRMESHETQADADVPAERMVRTYLTPGASPFPKGTIFELFKP